jgi:hypothetical protein
VDALAARYAERRRDVALGAVVQGRAAGALEGVLRHVHHPQLVVVAVHQDGHAVGAEADALHEVVVGALLRAQVDYQLWRPAAEVQSIIIC